MRLIVMRTALRLVAVLAWAALMAVTAACDPAAEQATSASGEAANAASTPAKTTVQGDPAVWIFGPDQSLPRSSARFTALVWRLSCNNGVTGKVFAPKIRTDESAIVVTFVVEPKQPGPQPCQGNDQVSYDVDLGEPLRDRALIDGQCLGGMAATTGFCVDGATRFKP